MKRQSAVFGLGLFGLAILASCGRDAVVADPATIVLLHSGPERCTSRSDGEFFPPRSTSKPFWISPTSSWLAPCEIRNQRIRQHFPQ